MTKLTNGIFLGSILGLFLSIVVYFIAPDLYPVYPNVLYSCGFSYLDGYF